MATTTDQLALEQLYIAYFGRAADPTGFAAWTAALDSGKDTLASIANEFANSAESKALYPQLGTGSSAITSTQATAFVAAVYQNLYHRDPDSNGLAYFVARLTTTNSGDIIKGISLGAQGTDKDYLGGVNVLALNYTTSVTAATYTTADAKAAVYTSDTLTLNGDAAVQGTNFFSGMTPINGVHLTVRELAVPTSAPAAEISNSTITHQILAKGAYSFNEVLYSGIASETLTSGVGVAGSSLTLTNASSATTFGVSDTNADTLNVSFAPGVTKQTFAVNLNGAGSGSTAAKAVTVDYVGTAAAEINKMTVATTGTNNVILNGTTSVTNVTVTGAGTNTIDLSGANAVATSALTVDTSAATGTNLVDLGAAYATTDVFTGNAKTTIGVVLPAAAVTGSQFNTVGGLQIDSASVSGAVLVGTGNTSVTTVTDYSSGDVTLTGFSGITSLVVNASAAEGAVTITNSAPTLAVTYPGQGVGVTVAATKALTVGQLTVNGTTALTIDTTGGVGSTAGTTFTGISDNTLSSLKVTAASTGLTALGTVTANTGSAGVLSTLDLSGIAGTASVTIAGGAATTNSIATGAVITGAVKGSTISFGGDEGKAFNVNLTGSNTFNGAAQTGVITLTATDAATNTNGISTGAGNDIISVGAGANTINAGAGANTITLGTHVAAQIDTINATVAGSDTINGLIASDLIRDGVSGETIILGTHAALTTASTSATTGAIVIAAAQAAATLNGVVAGDVIVVNGGNTLTLGTHAADNAIYLQTGGSTQTFAGLVAGDTITVGADLTGETIDLGSSHTGAIINLSGTVDSVSAHTLANVVGDTINITGSGTTSHENVALGAHTTGATVNVLSSGTTPSADAITGVIAADTINIGTSSSTHAAATLDSGNANITIAGTGVVLTTGGASTVTVSGNAAGSISASTNLTLVGGGTGAIAILDNVAAASGIAIDLGSAHTGVDTITFAFATTNTGTHYSTITNAHTGDRLALGNNTGLASTVIVSAGTNVADIATGIAAVTSTHVGYFTVAGDTHEYIYAAAGTPATNATLIQLVGQTHTVASLDGTYTYITLS